LDESITQTSDLQRQFAAAGIQFNIYPQFDSVKPDTLYPNLAQNEPHDFYGLKQTKS
jgi:hypothetical protein